MSPSSEPASGDPRIGTVLSERFRIDAVLGKGGMGSVYRAEHIHMRKTVAIKVLHRELTALDEIVKRFEREAIAAGRIEHPNVAAALDFGQLADGSFYLALEYVPGKSLRDTLAEAGKLPLRRALAIARQVAAALAAAHAVDIVHRDLKPDNVMLIEKGDAKDFVKVLDFGIAKVAGVQRAGTQLTQIGTVFGTPQYMAPEQAAGQAVDHRADLYALGLILHEMLSGRPTFESEELIALITMQLTADPPELPPEVPDGVRALVKRMLDKSPLARPASASEVMAELAAMLRQLDAPSPSTTRSRTPKTPASSRIADRLRPIAANARPMVARFATRLGEVGRRRIAKRVPVWAAALALSGLGLLWMSLHGRSEPIRIAITGEHSDRPSHKETARDTTAPASDDGTDDRELDGLITSASRHDARALAELQRRAASSRSPRIWLAVARGLLKNRDLTEALDAFRHAIELDSSVAADSTMLSGLGYFGSRDDTFNEVLDFASEHMGQSGADLIFYIWSGTSEKTAATQRAHQLLSSRAVKSEMSEALKLALAVRDATGCEQFRDLLPKLRDAGDERSYVPLRDLNRTSGCGPDEREDCYECLRGDSLLKDALVQVQLRKAPHFEARRWR